MRAYYNEFDPHAAAWLRELIREGLLPQGEVDERSIKEVAPEDLKGFDQHHFFAGIGGWPFALELAGWPADRPVWTGSCPCQPYSSAGKQLGDADPRNLWPDFFRLISECRPVTVIGEQIEGAIRKGWLDRVCGDLEGAGYAVGSVVLGAHGAGAPHIRQRLFWVANDPLRGCGQGNQNQRWSDQRIRAGLSDRLRPGSADRCGARLLADAGRCGRGAGFGIAGGADSTRVRGAEPNADGQLRIVGNSPSDGRQEHERGPGARAEPDAPDAGRGPGGLGHADRTGSLTGRAATEGDGHGRSALANGSAGVALGNTSAPGLPGAEPEELRGAGRREEGRATREPSRTFWSDYALVPCRDGKARRFEPGSFPLAHGVPRKLGPLFAVLVGMGIDPKRAKRLVRNAGGRLAQAGRNRVGRLRGYGNAIVPQIAAEFVRAFLEVEAEAYPATETRAA